MTQPLRMQIHALMALLASAALLAGMAACGVPVLTAISAVDGHICGLKEDNSIHCWSIEDRAQKAGARYGEDSPPKGDNFTAISTS